MKVLFVGLDIYGQMGGIERFNERVVRAVSDLQEELVVLSLWDNAEDSERAQPGVTFIPCHRSKLKLGLRFLFELISYRPDCILCGHVLLFPLALLGSVLRPQASRLLIVHGVEVWGPPYRHITWLERFLVARIFPGVISVSCFTEQRMRESYGLNSIFYALPNAVDVEQWPSLLPRSAAPNSLLTVARLSATERDKGVDKVIHALPGVLKEIPETTYTVIGEGPLKTELQELADDLGVGRNVRFLGYVDDFALHNSYLESRVFIMPSSKEGFGIVFLEAWQHHLPVICGIRDAGAEVVTHNLNGLTVDPDSGDEIAQAVMYLLMNPEIAERMGEEGYNTLVRKYSHATFVRSLRRILQDALSTGHHSE